MFAKLLGWVLPDACYPIRTRTARGTYRSDGWSPRRRCTVDHGRRLRLRLRGRIRPDLFGEPAPARPTQLTLPLSGYLVWEGRFSFTAVMVASTAAAVGVSFVFYYLGARVSEESLRRFVGRYGRFVLVRESDLDKVSKEFERHGGKAILIFISCRA